MGSCIFEVEESAYGKRLEENAAILRDKINEAMKPENEMEEEKFLKCRNEILDVLEKYEADNWTSVRILSSAINEYLAPKGWQARVMVDDLPILRAICDRK